MPAKKNLQSFIEMVQSQVRTDLQPVVLLKEGVRGLFGENSGIEVAVLNDIWPGVLAHEYGHYLQYKEGMPEFALSNHQMFDEWINGNLELEPGQVDEMTIVIQVLERDAEARAISLIKEYKLGDVVRYTQQANKYVMSYEIGRRHRQWPAFSEAAIANFPKRLITNKQLKTHPLYRAFQAVYVAPAKTTAKQP